MFILTTLLLQVLGQMVSKIPHAWPTMYGTLTTAFHIHFPSLDGTGIYLLLDENLMPRVF
jgi:hypothetical protein